MSESPLTRLARALLLAAAAVVLVGLVAVAANGYGLGGSGSGEPTPYAIDTILTIVLGAYAVGTVLVLAAAFWAGLEVRRNPQQAQLRGQRKRSGILLAVGLLIVLGLLASGRFRWVDLSRLRRDDPATTLPTTPQAGRTTPGSRQRRDPQFQWVPFVVVFGTAGVAAAAFVVAERRRKRRLPPEPLAREALADVLDETLTDLRSEPDPRRAVIAAYARMERALGAHGVPRQPFEAPHEYLGRVLAELTAGRLPAQRLTRLFERARFSPHAIDAGMKEDAIDAIEELQVSLAAVEAEEAA